MCDRKGSRERNRRQGHPPKKRNFRGNQHTVEKDSKDTEFVSTSADKLKDLSEFEVNFDPGFSYCFLSFNLVFTALRTILKCKLCNSDIQFLKQPQRGLGFKICVKCSCQDYIINSCPMIKNAYEINRRITFVMRLLGVGQSGIDLFCSLMDLGSFNIQTYYGAIGNISVAVKSVAERVFKKAVAEEKQKNIENGYPENKLSVSGDGSWAKRGFSSLLGIVSLIGKYSNKILDVIVKSKVCKACQDWIGKEESVEYGAWYEGHKNECEADHEGSAGKMEVDGIIEMFKRSMEWFGVKYAKYIGDGDTKTYKNLLEEDPYNGDPLVEKKECVLHVKKRMYRRVKEAKKKHTQYAKVKKQLEEAGKKKAENETEAEEKEEYKSAPKKRKYVKRNPSSSKEKPKTMQLTNKVMLKLSTYYGLAILRNSDSLENMKKAIWATFYHMTSTNENPQHFYCPEDADSWCEYQKLKAEKKESTFTHPPTFDYETTVMLKPIYEELSSDNLLERCLGRNTQNNNESFNNCVWNLAPKHNFTGKKILEIATLTAACTFNEGFMTVLKIMEVMDVQLGARATHFAQVHDDERILKASKKTSEDSKQARAARRAAKAAEDDAYEETEGLLYAPGIAD